MGTLFPEDDDGEFPDFKSIPRATATIEGMIVPLAITATLHGLCPVEFNGHLHPPHHDHASAGKIAMQLFAPPSSSDLSVALSGVQASTAVGNVTPHITVPAIKIAPTGSSSES